MAAIDSDQLIKTVQDLLHAADVAQVKRILAQNRWLIHHADKQLTQMIAGHLQHENLSDVAAYLAARGFLRRCREKGIEHALSFQTAWPLLQYGPLEALLQLPGHAPPEQRIHLANRAGFDIDKSTEPEIYGIVLHNLGLGLHAQIQTSKADDFDTAVSYFAEAITLWQGSTISFARILTGHALTNLSELCLRNPTLTRRESIQRAMKWLQQAETVISPQSPGAVNLLMLKGNASLYNPAGERLHNIEYGITCYENALAFPKVDRRKLVEIKHNLAVAYRRRLAGDVAENYEKALEYAQSVIGELTPKSEQWARTTAELATIYGNRRKGNRTENLEEAIAHAKRALEVYQPDSHPMQHAQTKFILANFYCDRRQGDVVQNHLKAIQLFNDVLQLRTPDINPIGYAEAQNNLGTAYAALCSSSGDAFYQKAVHCYRTALEVYQPDYLPARRQNTAANWGNLAFRFGRWQEAHEAFQQAIRAGNELFAASGTESGRRVELAKSAGLGLSAAETYCLLKLRQPAAALVELERGKARQLAEALALDALHLTLLPPSEQTRITGLRTRLNELEYELRTSAQNDQPAYFVELGDQIKTLRAELNQVAAQLMPTGLTTEAILAVIPEEAVLVAPVVTVQGTAVFIIPGDATAVSMHHILWLDSFTSKHLNILLNSSDENSGWVDAYRDKFNPENGPAIWETFIGQFAEKLWTQLMEPIYQRLTCLHLLSGSSLFLMPQGGLGLLPLHAAGYEEDGKWHTFMDMYEVTIVPSAYALQVSRQRLEDRQTESLLTVVNPTPENPQDILENAPIEAHLVASHFSPDKHKSLVGDAATNTAVIKAMSSQAYLHFCCHGEYDWHNVMDSRLILTHQDRLTLADTLSHQVTLPYTRLVTLSACETGITELEVAPDEYVGMPGGFMHAGAPGVISTLWLVDDLSTAILMDQFYRNYFEDKRSPAKALRAAQLWVQQRSREEIGEFYEALFDGENDTILTPLVLAIELGGDPEELPFAHPFYWAAFTFAGS